MKNRFAMFCLSVFFVLCFAQTKAIDPPPQPVWGCQPSFPGVYCFHPVGFIYEDMVWVPKEID